MPSNSKFKQLTDAEKAIGKRIAAYRRFKLWHQYELATQIGISRDRLASIETGRVGLSTQAAILVAEELQISLLWVAEGIGQTDRFLKLPGGIEETAKEHKLFLDAWRSVLRDFFYRDWKSVTERHLAGNYTRAETKIEIPLRKLPVFKESSEVNLAQFQEQLNESVRALPRTGKEKLLALMVRILSRFDLDWELGRREHPGLSAEELNKIEVDKLNDSVNMRAMKARMPDFRERLKKLTAQRGGKTKLANFLNVPLAAISQWLSGKREPNGENAFRLLHWVEQQERKTKKP